MADGTSYFSIRYQSHAEQSSAPVVEATGLGPMSTALARCRNIVPLVSRIVAAVLGGYGLAALTSVAALALPIDRTQAVVTGMLASFIVYACAVIWVFAVRSARRAWLGLLAAAVPLLLAAWPLWTASAGGPAA